MAHVQRTGRSEVVVPASCEEVWNVVSDVTRTGEWSHECVEVRWLDGATMAAPGVRFRGRNRAGWVRWGRMCELITVDAPCEIAWRVVPTTLYPDSTVWRIRLEPTDGGTRIVQEFEVVRAPALLDPFYAALVPTHQDRRAALTADLRRLGDVAARPVAGSSAAGVGLSDPR